MFYRISIDPEICHGKPCVKGTRIMLASLGGLQKTVNHKSRIGCFGTC